MSARNVLKLSNVLLRRRKLLKKESSYILSVFYFNNMIICLIYNVTGNYGNKLDNSFSPSSSTTPPTNPVFDGEKYYYLPWSQTKPCIRVDSHWEDITFRLGVLNKLLKACHRLVSSRNYFV